jgi:hypothetical protein
MEQPLREQQLLTTGLFKNQHERAGIFGYSS